MKRRALLEIWTIIQEDLLKGPIEHIKQLLDPFIKTYKFFADTVKLIKTAWKLLVEGYQKGKQLLDKIFGSKMHKSFPRKYLESTNCGNGFWETTGKGNYRYPGIHAEIRIGKKVYAPFNGLLFESGEPGESQVTINIEDIKDTQIILDNVKIDPALNRREIGAGDVIGTVVHPKWCADGHIHISMRKTNSTSNFIDPSKYLERRKMQIPKWRQECDYYILRWMGRTIQSGSVTKPPKIKDKSPKIRNGTSSSNLDVAPMKKSSTRKRGKRSIVDNIVNKLDNFTKSLGLPGFDKFKEILSLNINNITLGQALGYLDDFQLSSLKGKIVDLLKKVESFVNQRTCNNPHSMDDNELKSALTLRGKSTSGARNTLIQRYLESDMECFGIKNMVKKNVYCTFQSDCLGMSCCLDLKFFIYRHAAFAFVRYDPCHQTLVMGLNRWTKTIHISKSGFTDEGTSAVEEDINFLNMAQLVVSYSVKQEDNTLKVSFGIKWCSTMSEECQDLIEFIKEAQIEMKDCSESKSTSSTAPRSNSLLNTTIKDVIKVIEFSGIDEDDINDLTEYLREAFQSWLQQQIKIMVVKLFGNEFDLFDMCMLGYSLSYGPYKVEIFSVTIPMQLGPIIVEFSLGAGGYYGAEFQTNICVLSMKATATVVPRIGSSAFGALRVRILVFTAELRLTGYVLTTSFPTKAEIGFSKFPLDVRARMDLVLIPLHLELHVIVKFELKFPLFTISRTLINKKIWSYTTKAINKNIFNLNDAEPDNSPPDFSWYGAAQVKEKKKSKEKTTSKPKGTTTPPRKTIGTTTKAPITVFRGKREYPNQGPNLRECDTDRDLRKKRSTVNIPRCEVYQIHGRDYTDPAFVLQLGVADDKSPVYLTYCIGTYYGGCNIVKDEELGGPVTTVPKVMITGQELFFTVTAKNNAGMGSQTVCELSTYDMTLPTGRIKPQFYTTSHPEILRASVLFTDDSQIVSKVVSVGYGHSLYGGQIIDMENFTTVEDNNQGYTGPSPLTKFTNPKEGRLPWAPFYSHTHYKVEVCAQRCLSYQPFKCQAFNYDHDIDGGLCELLDNIEGEIALKKSKEFHYYERYGLGHVATFNYEKLHLKHNTLAFFNVYLQNELDYHNHISSRGILVDLTTPSPGFIANASLDTTLQEDCVSYTPKEVQHKCTTQTTIKNSRHIVDGKGSTCIFNGHQFNVDERYTRSNKMASANWDGIHDDETGILMYTWAVGQAPCASNIHPHTDPHAHLGHESEWSNQGSAYPLNLADGAYYTTMRALNKVEFGGPLSLTVCHYLPLIVDNTPPIIHNVSEARYDEENFMITMPVNASDDLSLIKESEVGLGRSRRDTYILEWQHINDYSNILYKYRIPDGIPVWVKIRVTNNVELKTVGHAPRAIFVDLTKPIAGSIFHGTKRGTQRKFQWEDDNLCFNWDGFYDPDSGISNYQLAWGTSPNASDIHDYVKVSYTVSSYCFTGLSLTHSTNYYVSMIAFNGAYNRKNISTNSQGVLIDATQPIQGSVKDNLPLEPDIKYSSNAATVKASWTGFSDPESGLEKTTVEVMRKLLGSSTSSAIYTEAEMDPKIEQIKLHHLQLLHGDHVTVSVNVTNGAGSSTSAKSDGFTVDLTKPVMMRLYDGYKVSSDREYSASLTTLAATWAFEEPESGIVYYTFTAYITISNRKHKIYPKNEETKILNASVGHFKTDETLSLIPGAVYNIRISALNGAGLTAVHDTSGVKIDNTPPTMLYVHAGVFAGESEEVIDGFVLHSNPEQLIGSWSAIDPESGIVEYLVSLGTSPGAQDVMIQTSFDTENKGLLRNINLALTSKQTSIPVYYINVISVNGAGMQSSVKSSSPVKVVSADQEGNVWDGPALSIQADVDFMLGHYTVTLGFSGFESELHGIAHYQWALGTRPRYDDVKSFSDYGIITNEHSGRGLGSSGYAQYIIELHHGQQYFATVRAITGAGNALDVSSDGFIVDKTSPLIGINALEDDDSSKGVFYVDSPKKEFNWLYVEKESVVETVWLEAGSYPGGNNIVTKTKMNDSINAYDLQLATPGQPYYLSVTAENIVGFSSSNISKAIVYDNTKPAEGKLSCPDIITNSTITCYWDSVFDKESNINIYLFGIGSIEGGDNILSFTKLSNYETSYTVEQSENLILQHNVQYFATLIAENNVGKKSNIYSSAMKVDNTPPVGRLVVEISDYYDINLQGIQTSGSNKLKGPISKSHDIKCQRDITKVNIAWEDFTDEESLIDHYEVALGVNPGSADVYPFSRVAADSNTFSFYPVDLFRIKRVYAVVRGYNKVGLPATAISDGVYISRISAGFAPLVALQVKDGTEISDVDYQYQNDRISAHWDLSGDPCPATSVQWSVVKFDGTVVSNMVDVPLEENHAEEDEINLRNGESFFVHLRVTNLLGYSYSLHSDGVTIKLQPLIPGIVRDGGITGIDLNYQPSTTSLSANWDGFGSDRAVDPSSGASDIGEHQSIHHYEVALGSDRRFPARRNNIHHFVNVGLNKTITFNHLKLVPKTAVYYVTVKAFSLSTTMVEVTSNGIRVGYGGEIISVGQININKYVTSTNKLFYSWSHFQFLVPVLRYYYAIKTGEHTIDDLDCTNMLTMKKSVQKFNSSFHKTFDFVPIIELTTDQTVTRNDLNLTQGATYTAYVLAVDESGTCAMTSAIFNVDSTPPTIGSLRIGPNLNLDLLFIPHLNKVSAWWVGYNDPESGIESFKIALMKGTDCNTYNPYYMTTVVDYVHLPPSSANHTFLELDLMVGEPYYLVLKVANHAGLEITKVSKPIISDVNSPTPGKVVDGINFKKDISFIGTNKVVKGSILYLPNPSSIACPEREYAMTAINNEWSSIVHSGMWLLPENFINNVIFTTKQVRYSITGMNIVMEYDVKSERMLSGAVQTKADMGTGGRYEFVVKAADALDAVTAITFGDWPYGIASDFSSPLMKGALNSNEDDTQLPKYDGYTIIPDPFPDDTFPTGYNFTKPEANSFGMHIVKNSSNQYHMDLWAVTKMKSSRHIEVLLPFDASSDWHTYVLLVNSDADPDNEDDWSLKLLVDGKDVAELIGISSVNEYSTLLLGVYNNHGIYTKVENMDVFNVPKTQASFRNIKLPASSEELCRYGDPFIGSDHPILKFYAGIGSSPGLTDVIDYQEVSQPCIPCQYPCDAKICDSKCDANKIQLIQVELTNLSLPYLTHAQTFDNVSIPAPYFISVKGMTGSGKNATFHSNGFYVDTTPPKVSNIYHVDMAWNDYEPSRFQGSNSTIFVYWEGVDEESEITEYKWAIGTSPNGTDVQEFVSVGTDEFGLNKNLTGYLKENTTYYATITAFNAAGLSSRNTSTGVTVSYIQPNVSQTKSSVHGTTAIGDKSKTKTVTSTNQESISVSWEKPTTKDADGIYCSLGSSPNANDIFPEIPCGLNNSGSVQVTSSGVSINNDDHSNLTDVKPPQRKKRSLAKQFLLEPGRVVYPNVKVCVKSHQCSNIPIDKVIIMKQHDRVLKTNTSGFLNGRLQTNNKQSFEYVEIQVQKKQSNELYLVTGILSPDDFKATYKSEASNNFKAYIVDPKKSINNTARDLCHRITNILPGGFYFTGIPEQTVDGLLIVKVKFPDGIFSKSSLQPTLLMWCMKEEVWVDSGKTCGSPFVTEVDWNNRILTVHLCNNKAYCEQFGKQSKRVKRQSQSGSGFTGSQGFAVAGTNSGFVNFPPVISSVLDYTINEDAGTFSASLTASDPENDIFVFLKNDVFKYTGTFTLSSSGDFTYKSCVDCFGIDSVHFVVKEVRSDGNTPLETNGVLTFNISEINDNPEIVLIKQGSISNGSNTITVDQYVPSIRVRRQTGQNGVDIILVSYDADMDTTKLTIEGQKQGNIMLHNQVVPYNVSYPDCFIPWSERKSEWDMVIQSIKNKEQFTLPVPCGLENTVMQKTVSWAVNVVTYTPNNGFTGKDSFKVIARDSKSTVSNALIVDIFVLVNPCLNNAKCYGPPADENCTDVARAYGFNNYSCICQLGYTGNVCETDIDECLSQPCSNNYTCIDKVNSYECKCETGWPCSEPPISGELEEWMLILIGGAGLLVFVLFIMCVVFGIKYCCCQLDRSETELLLPGERPRKRQKYGDHGNDAKPLKVVGAYALNPRHSRIDEISYSNPAYDSSDDYYYRHRPRSRSENRQHDRRLYEKRSRSSYASSMDLVRKWYPKHLVEEGGLYSSGYRPDRYDDRYAREESTGRRRQHQPVKRLRRSSIGSSVLYSHA